MRRKIILASGSPRRLELIKELGIEPTVIVSEEEEKTDADDPAGVVISLSSRKALNVCRLLKPEDIETGCLVIGADTIVVCNGEILGKPGSAGEAFTMLRMLSGRDHEVYTGITVVEPGVHNGVRVVEQGIYAGEGMVESQQKSGAAGTGSGTDTCAAGTGFREGRKRSFYEVTRVTVDEMSDEEIDEYIKTGLPFDKAGGYGIQTTFSKFISGIEGDYNNVVGLPVARLYRELKEMGYWK